MERPKLRYAYNEALINTYAEELEKYCDELEKISSTLSKSFSESMFKIYQLNKALDKACEVISSDICINCYDCYFEKECKSKEADKCIANNMNKDEWKEWCMK